MKKASLILVFIAIAEIVMGYVLYRNLSKLKTSTPQNVVDESAKKRMETEKKWIDSRVKHINESRSREIVSENIKISSNTKVTDTDGKQVDLKSITITGAKLVLRHLNDKCDDCRTKIFAATKMLLDSIGSENIVLFANLENYRDLLITKNRENFKFDCYNIKKYDLGLEMEKNSKLYVFVLDKDLTTKFCYYPDDTDNTTDSTYYASVIRWFKQNKK